MQMIDVLKRLAELDAQNPNVVKESSIDEYGMMGGMGMSQPHSPASINMTAATGEELSAMLKDIMTLAGRSMSEPEMPIGGEEPLGGTDGIAVVDVEPDVDVEPSPEVGADNTSVMRSMIDKLNPADDDTADSDADDSSSDDDEEEKVDEYDNTPDEQVAGYDAAVPSGNDLHKEKQQYPAAQPGDNAMSATYESLMAEYKKFLGETQVAAEGSKHASRPGTQARPGSTTQAQAAHDRKREHRAELDANLAQQAAEKNKTQGVAEADPMESILALAGLKK